MIPGYYSIEVAKLRMRFVHRVISCNDTRALVSQRS